MNNNAVIMVGLSNELACKNEWNKSISVIDCYYDNYGCTFTNKICIKIMYCCLNYKAKI